MSILIKGMEMPKNCYDCNFAVDGTCVAMQPISTRNWREKETTNFCPLIPIPDHGDLIEKTPIIDALTVSEKSISVIQRGAEAREDIRYCQGVMIGYANSILALDNAPIVIPAERREWEEPEINPCGSCQDYDGFGGCKSRGGCAERSEE